MIAVTIAGDRAALAGILREAADRVSGGGSYEWGIPRGSFEDAVSILFAPATGLPKITIEEVE